LIVLRALMSESCLVFDQPHASNPGMAADMTVEEVAELLTEAAQRAGLAAFPGIAERA